ncbi:MAG: type II toxin-antitoxin system Phd/YefM family antitoxin [Lachnospiraceae bacterium]|nr:type II toxin-antitoxin system Phd/YefM family antitoxin [Lachnospiraceae bacterium]
MINVNATNFRKNLFNNLELTIKYNEPIHVTTKDGNAIVISESDYNSLMETLYLSSIPKMKDIITKGLNTPLSDTVSEDEVNW